MGVETDSGFTPSGRPGMTKGFTIPRFPDSPIPRFPDSPRSPRLVVRAQRALFFEVPLAFFLGRALVVCTLAARDADFDLDVVVLPVHRQRHQGQALAFDRADEFVDFRAVQQQLAGPAILGDHVGGRGQQWRNRRAEQEKLAVLHQRVCVGKVDAPGAQAFHFPALQRDAGFVALVDVVLVAGALVERDRRQTVAVFFFLLRHARYNVVNSHAAGSARNQENSCRSIARRWFALRRNRCSTSSMKLKLTRGASPGASAPRCPSTMASTWSRAWTCDSPGSPSIFPPATRSIARTTSRCNSWMAHSTGCMGRGSSLRWVDRPNPVLRANSLRLQPSLRAAKWHWISTSKSAIP